MHGMKRVGLNTHHPVHPELTDGLHSLCHCFDRLSPNGSPANKRWDQDASLPSRARAARRSSSSASCASRTVLDSVKVELTRNSQLTSM